MHKIKKKLQSARAQTSELLATEARLSGLYHGAERRKKMVMHHLSFLDTGKKSTHSTFTDSDSVFDATVRSALIKN